jgi:sulfate permease, SulP family
VSLFSNIKGDISGALSAAIITLPMCVGYGIIVFAPLGNEYAPQAAMTGVYSAVFAGFLAAFFGGNPIQITGPKALLMFVQASLVSGMAAGHELSLSPYDRYLVIVGLASVSVFIAGIFQILFAVLRFGDITKYVPHPVVAGFTNGIGILLIVSQFKPLFGTDASFIEILKQTEAVRPLTAGVGLFTLAAILVSERFVKYVPASLVGLAVGTALYYGLAVFMPQTPLGPLIGIIRFEWPRPDIFLQLFHLESVRKIWTFVPNLVLTGLVIGLLSAMETLLSSVTSDNLTGNRHNSKRELIGQGIGNIVTSCFGSLAAAGSVPRTMANFKAGGRTPLSGMMCSISIFLTMMLLGPLVGKIPLTVIAGILITVGFSLFDRWTVKFIRKLIKNPLNQPKEILVNLLVTLTVTVVTVSANMLVAVGTGMAIASALFVSKMGKSVVKRRYFGNQFHSKKMRGPEHTELLENEGHRIVVFELQGPIFFGSAENLSKEVEQAMETAIYCILDMKRVNEIDSTGANILLQISRGIEKKGKYLLISHLRENRSLWEFLKVMDVIGMLGKDMFFSDTDRSLEWAEELMLVQVSRSDAYLRYFLSKIPLRRLPKPFENSCFRQSDTDALFQAEAFASPAKTDSISESDGAAMNPEQMNIVKGFTPEESAHFRKALIRQIYRKGEAVFREGDTGKDLYLLARGSVTVKIRLKESNRLKRLFTFTPGVTFGEVALLDGKPRSADVWAEEDAEVFRLSFDDFNALRKEKPEIVIKLLLNIAKEFSRNLRRISNEVRVLEDG